MHPLATMWHLRPQFACILDHYGHARSLLAYTRKTCFKIRIGVLLETSYSKQNAENEIKEYALSKKMPSKCGQ